MRIIAIVTREEKDADGKVTKPSELVNLNLEPEMDDSLDREALLEKRRDDWAADHKIKEVEVVAIGPFVVVP